MLPQYAVRICLRISRSVRTGFWSLRKPDMFHEPT